MVLEESQLYRDLMRFKPDDWSPNAWAVRAGVSRTVWTDMRRHGNPSRRTLEKLLTAAGSSLAEFEALRVGISEDGTAAGPVAGVTDRRGSPWTGSALPALPLIAASAGGFWDAAGIPIDVTELRTGAILDHLPRPASLAGDPGAYAFTMVSDAMWPRFRPGRRIAVSPIAGIAPGDDVLVAVSSHADGKMRAILAEMVSQSAEGFELRQFNPDAVFRIPSTQCAAVHRVMGELF